MGEREREKKNQSTNFRQKTSTCQFRSGKGEGHKVKTNGKKICGQIEFCSWCNTSEFVRARLVGEASRETFSFCIGKEWGGLVARLFHWVGWTYSSQPNGFVEMTSSPRDPGASVGSRLTQKGD